MNHLEQIKEAVTILNNITFKETLEQFNVRPTNEEGQIEETTIRYKNIGIKTANFSGHNHLFPIIDIYLPEQTRPIGHFKINSFVDLLNHFKDEN